MTEIPENLKRRAEAARIRAGQTAAPERSDPFEQRRTNEAQSAARLLTAKTALITNLGPIRHRLESSAPTLGAQLVKPDNLRIGSVFTPPRRDDTAASFTIYGRREAHIGIEGGKSLRVGEEHAWRVMVPKREIATFLKGAGKRPILDVLSLVRGDALFAEQADIDPRIVSRVFEGAAAERVTNSVVLYEGNPNAEDYALSDARRYGVSATIVRNPASVVEEAGTFGVDFRTIDGQLRIDEKPMEDGTKIDFERVAISDTFGRRLSSGEMVIRGIEAAASVMGVYGALLETPTEQGMLEACMATDGVLTARRR